MNFSVLLHGGSWRLSFSTSSVSDSTIKILPCIDVGVRLGSGLDDSAFLSDLDRHIAYRIGLGELAIAA